MPKHRNICHYVLYLSFRLPLSLKTAWWNSWRSSCLKNHPMCAASSPMMPSSQVLFYISKSAFFLYYRNYSHLNAAFFIYWFIWKRPRLCNRSQECEMHSIAFGLTLPLLKGHVMFSELHLLPWNTNTERIQTDDWKCPLFMTLHNPSSSQHSLFRMFSQ